MFVWLERTELDRRPPEFGALDWDGEHVAMAYANGATALWDAWLGLPPHVDVLEPLSQHRLRYAALDFDYVPTARALATAGAKLTWIADYLLTLAPTNARLFANPVLYFDVQAEPRVGFDDAPSVPRRRTRTQEMIAAIGRAIERYNNSELARACASCADGNADSLVVARQLFEAAGAGVVGTPGTRPPRKIYAMVEPAIGLVHLGKLADAHRRFSDAFDRAPKAPYVRALVEATKPKTPYVRYEAPDPQRPRAIYPVNAPRHFARYDPDARWVEWSAIADAAADHERRRAYSAALAMYERVMRSSTDASVLDTALARCHFGLGNFATALAAANRSLPLDHERAELVMKAQLRLFRFADAIAVAEQWPDDGFANYVRGRGLLGLGNPLEARDAFERASQLAPNLLEAQLLFRETDRAVKRLRGDVGVAVPIALDVPAHLHAVAELVGAGKLVEATRELARYDGDADAHRLRGELLAFLGRADDSLDAFESSLACADTVAARLGKAHALLELDRADAALALFEPLDSIEALEGKARALQLLGRDDEADAAFAAALDRADAGAELRARATRR